MEVLNFVIIGAGNIAIKHLEVIKDISWITVTGISSRTHDKAKIIADRFRIEKVFSDYENMIMHSKPDGILVLVSEKNIFNVTKSIMHFKIPLFIEKPPGLLPQETKIIADFARENKVVTMVGYNRRYYSIFHEGIRIIKDHGDLLGVTIEGHERYLNLIDKKKEDILNSWLYVNSTHTLDLLRFFGGEISKINFFSVNRFNKYGDQFAMILEYKSKTIGSYISHWNSPGGWSVKLYGNGVTVEFKPLECGKWYEKDLNEFEIIPDQEDIQYKQGFYKQMIAFGNLIKTKTKVWPLSDLDDSYNTMKLAESIILKD